MSVNRHTMPHLSEDGGRQFPTLIPKLDLKIQIFKEPASLQFQLCFIPDYFWFWNFSTSVLRMCHPRSDRHAVKCTVISQIDHELTAWEQRSLSLNFKRSLGKNTS